MQHTQHYFVQWVAVALFCGLGPAWGGTIAHPTPPDPLLDGGHILDPQAGPCARLAAGADYAAGTDATGKPVVPADVGAGPVPLPDSIAVPLGQGRRNGRRFRPNTMRQGAFVELDGRRLAPLLDTPACGGGPAR